MSVLFLAAVAALAHGCTKKVAQRRGDLAKHGGSPSIRVPYEREPDDPSTTNDESNDQPLGHFGTVTLQVMNQNSGNSYPLDAEVAGTTLERVYFPKGGWVDFYDCELDEDLTGECEDEGGRWWTVEGESYGAADPEVEEEEHDSDDLTDDDDAEPIEED